MHIHLRTSLSQDILRDIYIYTQHINSTTTKHVLARKKTASNLLQGTHLVLLHKAQITAKIRANT